MKPQRRLGWSMPGILAIVFLPMGLLYLSIGLIQILTGLMVTRQEAMAFLITFGAMGFVFALAGGICLFLELTRRRRMRDAYETGSPVMGEITCVEPCRYVRFNSQNTYVVVCTADDPYTHEKRVCRSRLLRRDPTPLLTSQQVPVYFDPMNPKAVFVDIDAAVPEGTDLR